MKEHFITVNDISENHDDKDAMIGGYNANFSKHFGLKRVAAHYFKIPPNRRTSRPHAERFEEEFVFVISGEIDIWFNGKIKKMVAGDCIGFPAGTGVGHTFINNSNSDVELFVAGDRTKKENQYRFHLEPKLADECGANWWSDMPEQELGKHDGLPGEFDQSILDNSIITFYGFDKIDDGSFSYPGDSETFGNGVCLSRRFRLKSIAVNLVRLKPGKRSAWPHAHSVDEEFVYILKGKPTIWLNGIGYLSAAMSAIDFKAGSGVAHTLINETDEDIYYLCLGECEPLNDKIFYPLHPDRNKEVEGEGWFWSNYPAQKTIKIEI